MRLRSWKLRDFPLTVLTNDYGDSVQPDTDEATNVEDQQGWFVLSPNEARQVVVTSGHNIAGNAMVVFGPDTFNGYAATLGGNPLIPVIEVVLLIAFLIHIYKTVTMYLRNQQARPVAYAQKKYAGRPSRKTLASSTMIVTGLWLRRA